MLFRPSPDRARRLPARCHDESNSKAEAVSLIMNSGGSNATDLQDRSAVGIQRMIRTVVVGYGLAGRAFHCPLIERQQELQLHGIVARDPAVRAKSRNTGTFTGTRASMRPLTTPGPSSSSSPRRTTPMPNSRFARWRPAGIAWSTRSWPSPPSKPMR